MIFSQVPSFPYRILFSITSRCQLDCLYCASKKNISNELTTEEIYYVIDNYFKDRILEILLCGGEPFLKEDILDIIKKIRSYNIGLKIDTNGIYFSDRCNARYVVEKLGVKKFAVSLDGPIEIHNKYRCNSFDLVLRGISNLVKYTKNVSLFANLVPEYFKNLKLLEEVFKLCSKLRIPILRFNNIVCNGNARKNFEQYFLSKELKIKIANEIYYLSKKYSNIKVIANILRYNTIKKYNMFSSCYAGIHYITIMSNGDVSLCPIVDGNVFGNIRKKSLLDIWRSKKLNYYREKFFSIKSKNNSKFYKDADSFGLCVVNSNLSDKIS